MLKSMKCVVNVLLILLIVPFILLWFGTFCYSGYIVVFDNVTRVPMMILVFFFANVTELGIGLICISGAYYATRNRTKKSMRFEVRILYIFMLAAISITSFCIGYFSVSSQDILIIFITITSFYKTGTSLVFMARIIWFSS